MLIVLEVRLVVDLLGSGTSGGTLAPLFTIGGGLGALLGGAAVALAPALGVDPHVAALVGMAAIFAGASRALLASVVFAFETTRQPMGLLPLLAGCSAAYLVSLLLMRSSIMTEKLARRGTRVRTEYSADFLDRVSVGDAATREVVTLNENTALTDVIDWLSTRGPGTDHQGFPVLADDGTLVGVVTRRDLLDPSADETWPVRAFLRRAPVVAFEDNTLRDAADHMVHEKVGRLPVVSRCSAAAPRGNHLAQRSARRRTADVSMPHWSPRRRRSAGRGSSGKRLEHFVDSRVALVTPLSLQSASRTDARRRSTRLAPQPAPRPQSDLRPQHSLARGSRPTGSARRTT